MGSAPKDGLFLKYFIIEDLVDSNSYLSFTYLKFIVVELSLRHVDVHLDMFALIIRVDELCFTNEGSGLVALVCIDNRHSGLILNGLEIGVDCLGEFWRLANHFIVDVDLILNRDS